VNIVGVSQVNVIWVVVGLFAESVVVGFVVVSVVAGVAAESVVVGFVLVSVVEELDAGRAAVGSKLDLLSEHPDIIIKKTAHGSRTGMIYIQAL